MANLPFVAINFQVPLVELKYVVCEIKEAVHIPTMPLKKGLSKLSTLKGRSRHATTSISFAYAMLDVIYFLLLYLFFFFFGKRVG